VLVQQINLKGKNNTNPSSIESSVVLFHCWDSVVVAGSVFSISIAMSMSSIILSLSSMYIYLQSQIITSLLLR
jgi:hypothetical protein